MNPDCGRILQHYFGFLGNFDMERNNFFPPDTNAFVIKKGLVVLDARWGSNVCYFSFWKKGIRKKVETPENVGMLSVLGVRTLS